MPLPWGLLNQTIIRKRPIQATDPYGDAYATGYDMQEIRAQVQQYQRRGTGGENVDAQGIVTKKVFTAYFNYVTDPVTNTPTDVMPTDRMIIVDASGQQLETRIEDYHDGAGMRHHIECKLIYTSPTGD